MERDSEKSQHNLDKDSFTAKVEKNTYKHQSAPALGNIKIDEVIADIVTKGVKRFWKFTTNVFSDKN